MPADTSVLDHEQSEDSAFLDNPLMLQSETVNYRGQSPPPVDPDLDRFTREEPHIATTLLEDDAYDGRVTKHSYKEPYNIFEQNK